MNRIYGTYEGETHTWFLLESKKERVLIGKQEGKNNLQDLDTDGSYLNLSYRSRMGEKLAGFIWFRILTISRVL